MPIIKSADAPSHHKVMHWQWQRSWAVREGNWKLLGRREKGTHLGNLGDAEPEKKNYLKEETEIAKRLQGLHDEWSKEVERVYYEQYPKSTKMY